MEDFIHLHVHTYYSILDGQSKIKSLVDKAIDNGMRGMAITDHGNMFGIKELLDFCKKHNGKPQAKVKECKENIEKAQALVAAIPDIQEKIKSSADKTEVAALKVRLQDAEKAQKALSKISSKIKICFFKFSILSIIGICIAQICTAVIIQDLNIAVNGIAAACNDIRP